MKRSQIYISLLIFTTMLLLPVQEAEAQRYPIQVSTMISPPYSLRLSDYVESGFDRIQVTIHPNDMNLVGYRVKLKLVIESFDGRIRIETAPGYLPPPVFLNGGVPEILGSYDIQDLFNINNLVFSGISKTQYNATKQLPEGYYRIGFVAVDYNRATTGNDVVVSNYGFAMAGLYLNDPPILNLPQNRKKVDIFEPQYILFQWTPRHQGSPNSAFSAEYVFRLYEVWTGNTDPNLIASTQLPIFETVTHAPRLNYGIAEPMLVPGKSYVWTVQAREPENRDLFRNRGRSEAFIFQYGDACLPPQELNAEAVNGPGMELKWKGASAHTDYIIRYRSGSGNWYEESSLLTNSRLYDLQHGSTYEVQVMSNCGTYNSEYGDPVMVTLPEEPAQQFACGVDNAPAAITNQDALPMLSPGDRFTAGGFQCRVTEAEGSDGTFSGTCLVTIPFYGFAKVVHTFENISINTDRQMYAGKLVAVKDEARDAAFMAALEDQVIDERSTYTNEYIALVFAADEVISTDKPIESLVISESGELVVTYADGETETIEVAEDETVVVADSEGNQYVVENGQVNEVTPDLVASRQAASGGAVTAVQTGNIDSLRATLKQVRFAPALDMKYGFDSLKYAGLRSQYTEEQILGENYVIPFKAVATGQIDQVHAIAGAESNPEAAALSFKSQGMTLTPADAGENGLKKISVSTLTAGEVIPLEVVYNMQDSAGNNYEEPVGKLNLIGYDKQLLKLYLVPVNDDGSSLQSRLTTIRDYVNAAYGQAAVEWDVNWHEPLMTDAWDINGDGVFDNTDRDDRMDYTSAMKKIRDDFKDNFDTDRDALYVFVLDEPVTDAGMQGYMPFKKQYAFIFTANLGTEALAHVVAHEIGHGAFNLRHTFSDRNSYTLTEGSTQNLMDYSGSGANELNKYQWDFIHDPESMLFAFLEDEDEGEAKELPIVRLDVMKATTVPDLNYGAWGINKNSFMEVLDQAEKLSVGAFLLVNNDDDNGNYVSDKNEQNVTGESDLLPIIVHAASYGYFRFSTTNLTGGNIKIWENSNGSLSVPLNTSFEAPETNKTYYLEGVTRGELTLSLSWNKKEDFSKPDILTDEIKLSIGELQGAINVPNFSKYQYEIFYPNSAVGSWSNIINGNEDSRSGASLVVHWQDGQRIGQVEYEFNENYSWIYEVNIVELTIVPQAGVGTNDLIDIPRTPHDPTLLHRTRASWRASEFGPYFSSGDNTSFGHPYAIRSRMHVTAEGPDYNTIINRGVEKMEVGFIQNIQFTDMEILYADGIRLFGNIVSPTFYIDKDIIAARPDLPFYSAISYTSNFTAVSSNNKLIEYQDRPTAYFKRYSPGNPQSLSHHWEEGYWEENFTLWICARSLDQSNDVTATYTILKEADWSFIVDDRASNVDIPDLSGIFPISVGDAVGGSVTLPNSFNFINVNDGSTPTTTGGNAGNHYLQTILLFLP